MQGLLGELGKKLAERWATLLVLPGLLYLAAIFVALTLRQGHALDVYRLSHEITSRAENPTVTASGGQFLVLATVLLGAALAGLLAQATGSWVERAALAAGWRLLSPPLRYFADRRVQARRTRWQKAKDAYTAARQAQGVALARGERPDSSLRHAAFRKMNRVSLERPDRPTWCGDRLHATGVRVDREHNVDLGAVWPLVWLILPDPVRSEITATRAALSRAAVLGGWSLLYLPLAIWWWPAAVIAVVLAATARHRIRSTTDSYARLLEAAVRLNIHDLPA